MAAGRRASNVGAVSPSRRQRRSGALAFASARRTEPVWYGRRTGGCRTVHLRGRSCHPGAVPETVKRRNLGFDAPRFRVRSGVAAILQGQVGAVVQQRHGAQSCSLARESVVSQRQSPPQ